MVLIKHLFIFEENDYSKRANKWDTIVIKLIYKNSPSAWKVRQNKQ